jgi:DNA-binding GntR family transcriptional regulator
MSVRKAAQNLAAVKSISKRTQQGSVYSAIRDAILSGLLQPDAPLSVRALAAALKVGTMSARTAVQRLIAERALERNGTNRKLCVPALSPNQFLDLLNVASELEVLAVRRVPKPLESTIANQLRSSTGRLNSVKKMPSGKKLLQLTQQFWFTLFSAANSPVLEELFQNLWLRLSPVLIHANTQQASSAAAYFDNTAHYRKFLLLMDALEFGSTDDALYVLISINCEIRSWFLKHYALRNNSK